MYETLRKLLRGVAAVIATALAFGLMQLAAPLPMAQAATNTYAQPLVGLTLPGGPGHLKPVYAGSWIAKEPTGTIIGDCADFSNTAPVTAGKLYINGVFPGMTAANSAKALTLMALYGRTTDKSRAAALALKFWSLRGQTNFKTWWAWATKYHKIPTTVMTYFNQMGTTFYGPFVGTVSTTPILVGQHATVISTLVGVGRKPAAGLKVTMTCTGCSLSKTTGVTNAKGQLAVTQTRTATGRVTICSTFTVPSWRHGWLTNAAPGTQRLLAGTFETMRACTSYDKVLGKPAMMSSCDTNCEGISTVTFVPPLNPTGSKMVKWTWYDVNTGATVATLSVAPGTTGQTSVKLHDGDIITNGEYCYVNTSGGACVTATVKLAGTQEVVCPGWVHLTFTGDCPCSAGSVNFVYTLTSPTVGNRSYQVIVKKNGVAVQTLDLVNGVATTTNPVSMTSGDRVQVEFFAYRDATHVSQLRTGTLFDMSNNL